MKLNMFVKSVLLIVYVLGASPAEDSTSVFVTTWMVPSTLFQLSCSRMKMLMVRGCSLPDDHGQ